MQFGGMGKGSDALKSDAAFDGVGDQPCALCQPDTK